jgi:hypothetical protein
MLWIWETESPAGIHRLGLENGNARLAREGFLVSRLRFQVKLSSSGLRETRNQKP